MEVTKKDLNFTDQDGYEISLKKVSTDHLIFIILEVTKELTKRSVANDVQLGFSGKLVGGFI